MKGWISLAFIVLLGCRAEAQQNFMVTSPGASLKLKIATGSQLAWALYAGDTLLQSSDGIELELRGGRRLSLNLGSVKSKSSAVRETIQVPVPYRRKQVLNHYNQLILTFNKYYAVEFRVYDNGMAYRIGIQLKDTVLVHNERAVFSFDSTATMWHPQLDRPTGRDKYHTGFEGQYRKVRLLDFPDTAMTYAPVVISLKNGFHIAITDANLNDYPGMFLKRSGNTLQGEFAPYPLEEEMTSGEFPQLIVTKRAPYIAKIAGTRMLPWRAVLVARSDIDLPSNDIVYALGDPSKLEDASWVKAGKGTDEWICGINLFNVPFVAGLNTATYKFYIDFAKKFGFDQIMLDAGWSNYKDLFDINPSINMDTIAAYGRQQGIKLMLWTLCSTLDRQLEPALAQFNKWGVTSIMTDFMDRDDQQMVNFYHRIARACADHKISVMFHGAFPPKGFNRTWPNAITYEGALGAEWNIWSELATPEHNVALAYTRMLAGPLDYEPGLLLNAQKDQFRPIGKNPMSIGTRCHQLAMFAVYDSPLQIFSGNPSQALKEPEFMQLLGSVPVTWDDTKILSGKIGEFIVTARKTGNDWYIAGLNNSTARYLQLPANFLPPGTYRATLCKDGLNAHQYGSDYEIVNSELRHDQSIDIHMAPGGGFLLRLIHK
ncbi:MAG: glycoside hydrolase family 97 protein [Chitinophagaceae bacterium]|nr:glycoside hydrolase family 97 protein [Chitinophagaceae bacterium]